MKPIASLSLDLDNKWSYLKTHGDVGWESFPSYLDVVVPRALQLLAERHLTITFFVVGQDAARERHYPALSSIAQAGHEIGNHSFTHDQSMHLFSREAIEREVAAAEEHLTLIAGKRPVGFRGPGFSVSQATLEVLRHRGYLYDASTLPTYFGPLARLYYFFTSHLSAVERARRRSLFGSVRDGFRSLKPYRWPDGVLEIPVTTLPIVRLPIHVSYVVYLSTFSSALALSYLRTALALCRLTAVSPSLLLHSLDLVGIDDEVSSGLGFFPGMTLCSSEKLKLVSEVLNMYCNLFRVVSVEEHALFAIQKSEGGELSHSAAPPLEKINSPSQY